MKSEIEQEKYLQKRIEQEIKETSSIKFIFLNLITLGMHNKRRIGLA